MITFESLIRDRLNLLWMLGNQAQKRISFYYSNQVPGTDWLNLGCGKQKRNCRSTALVTQLAFQRISVLSKVTCNNKSVLLFVQKMDYQSLIITLFVFFEQVLTSDLSCQVTTVMGQAVLTASSWYLVLMAIERFMSTVFARSQVSLIFINANTFFM